MLHEYTLLHGYRYSYKEIVPEIPKDFGHSWYCKYKNIQNKESPIWVRGNRCIHMYVPDYIMMNDEWHKEKEEFKGRKIKVYRAICNDKSWISDIHEPIIEIEPGTEILNNTDINTGICSKCSNYLENYLNSNS